MHEHAAKTLSKEEKRQNFRSNMHSLRKNLLAGGGSAPLSQSSTKHAKARTRALEGSGNQFASTTAGNSEEDDQQSTASMEVTPRYVDRAKLRRSIYPPQHGLSDADPPHSASKRSRLSSPAQGGSAKPVEPSYGPGAALFQKMLQGQRESTGSEGQDVQAPSRKAPEDEVKMGKVIEVRSMADRNAGLGSGSVLKGVEQHGTPIDWRDAARQRRWREANR